VELKIEEALFKNGGSHSILNSILCTAEP